MRVATEADKKYEAYKQAEFNQQLEEMLQLEGVDLFCGAGGVTEGVENAEIDYFKIAKVLACVNHDANAIASHLANHPECQHFIEDIRTIQLSKLPKNQFKRNVLFFLHASLECTNFSNAKGGKPRDGDSRTLADHMDEYVLYMQPDIFTVENVREFMAWGKLDKNGKPVSRDKGADYLRWVERIKSYGYNYDYRLINSADHGAYTSRLRYFGIFSKPGVNISFPEATHAKKPEKQNGLFGKPLLKWNAVKHVLDLVDEGVSIFGRKKQHSEKSLERVYAGLVKFVAGGKENFLAKYYSGKPEGKVITTDGPAGAMTTTDSHALISINKAFIIQRNTGEPETKITSIEDPARTITTTGGNQEIVQSEFLVKTYAVASNSDGVSSVENPANTITTKDGIHKVHTDFLVQYNGSDARTVDIEGPAMTVTTANRFALVQSQYLASYYGNGENVGSTDSPSGTITTKDRIALVTAKPYIVNHYGNSKAGSVDEPINTLTPTPKSDVVSPQFMTTFYTSGENVYDLERPTGSIMTKDKIALVSPFLLGSNFDNPSDSIEEPAKTIVASRHHKYIVNPQWFNNGAASIEDPACTLIARMDKAPLSIVTTEFGEALAIIIYESDTPMMVKIKEFMALYGIVDIKMRMLKIPELLLIQGFPKGYKLIGTQTEQKKYIGNAVVSLVMKKWFESIWMANKPFDRLKDQNERRKVA